MLTRCSSLRGSRRLDQYHRHMKVINGQSLSKHPGPLINGYLWDQAAHELYNKFNECLAGPAVVIVTASNTKRTGGEPEILSKGEQVSAEGMLLIFALNMNQFRDANVTGVEMYITKPLPYSFPYYVGYVSFLFVKGTVVKYRSMTMAGRNFVLLGDTGPELTGRQTTELIDNYFEANGDMCDNHEMPTPQCLVEVSS
ncbi:Uncharacterized protein Rs2_09562 [Raphanus sativus]|nr:Uncharacterized protein Rs2_09562 [Raphanus sativus]